MTSKKLKSQQAAVTELLLNTFGYHILQLGITHDIDYIAATPIKHKIYSAQTPTEGINICCKIVDLPFLVNSIDVIVLPNVLSKIGDPLMVLNQTYHVLIPGGHLLIVEKNPFKFFWLYLRRTKKRLNFLGFKILAAKKNNGLYLLLAKKSMRTPTMLPKIMYKHNKPVVHHCI